MAGSAGSAFDDVAIKQGSAWLAFENELGELKHGRISMGPDRSLLWLCGVHRWL